MGERQVQVAAKLIRRLASRHQWSALSVPLLWAAAEDDRECPVLTWSRDRSQSLQNVSVAGVQMAGPGAVTDGVVVEGDRSMRIWSREQFAEWTSRARFPDALVVSSHQCKSPRKDFDDCT